MKSHKIVHNSEFNGYPINNDHGGNHGEILEKIHTLINTMTSRYSRVLAFRFDLRFPKFYQVDPYNDTFRKFMREFLWHFRRKGIAIQYIAVREQRFSEHPHFHVVCCVDGHKCRTAKPFIEKADELWTKVLEIPYIPGLVYHPRNGIFLDHNDRDYNENLRHLMSWFSYLAKTDDKSDQPCGTRKVFKSKCN